MLDGGNELTPENIARLYVALHDAGLIPEAVAA
jgi:hypothetical protein